MRDPQRWQYPWVLRTAESRVEPWEVRQGDNPGGPSLLSVGSLSANDLGLHDLLGNVFEWCRDRFGSYELPVAPETGEREGADTDQRIYRGGSIGIIGDLASPTLRLFDWPEFATGVNGVRPSRALE